MWVNPIDKVPQVRVDWANHIIWGGGLGAVIYFLQLVAAALPHWRVPFFTPAEVAALVVMLVAGGKKLVDYVKVGPPTESAAICIGKAFVTALWPATFVAFEWINSLGGVWRI